MICLQIFQNSFSPEIRGRRSLNAAESSAFFEQVIGEALLIHKDQDVMEIIGDGIKVHRRWYPRFIRGLLSRINIFFHLRGIHLALIYRNKPVKLIHCHDYDTIPIAFRIAKDHKCPVIFDAHELETGRSNNTPSVGKLIQNIENRYLSEVDTLITVTGSIEKWYQENYTLKRTGVIRNIPEGEMRKERDPVLRDDILINDDIILFGYVGHLIEGRYLEELIEIFKMVNDPLKHLVFMGKGKLEERLKKFSSDYEYIHVHPAVPMDQVKRYASGMDVGLNVTNINSLSRKFGLPNKFFQYIHSGVPIMANDTPERKKLIEQYGIGWTVPVNPESIAERISLLTRDDIRSKRKKVIKAQKELNWENERKKLINIYKELTGDDTGNKV